MDGDLSLFVGFILAGAVYLLVVVPIQRDRQRKRRAARHRVGAQVQHRLPDMQTRPLDPGKLTDFEWLNEPVGDWQGKTPAYRLDRSSER